MRKQNHSPESVAVRESLPMASRNFSVEDAAAVIGVGRAFAFELIRTHKLKSIKVGRRRLVPGAVLEKYIATLAQNAA
jgi:excisionase family DNA binding protein